MLSCSPKNQAPHVDNKHKWLYFGSDFSPFSLALYFYFSSLSHLSDSLTHFNSRSLRNTHTHPLATQSPAPCAVQMPPTPCPHEYMCDPPASPPHMACQADHPVTLSLQGTLLRKHGKGLEKVMRASLVLRPRAPVSGLLCACVRLCAWAGQSAGGHEEGRRGS